MTSTGTLLDGRLQRPDELAPALQQVLDAYAQLPPETRVAELVDGEMLPQAPPPEGGLVLNIHERALGLDDGAYRVAADDDFYGNPMIKSRDGQRDSLWLSQEECRSLIPEDPQPSQTHAVLEKLAKRIGLYGLIPQTTMLDRWQADSLKACELRLTVEEVTPERLVMRIHGGALLSRPDKLSEFIKGKRTFLKDLIDRYDSRIEGTLEVDRTAQRIVRWEMTALGNYTGKWYADGRQFEATDAQPLRLGFAFSLDESVYQLPPQRRRPRSFMHAHVFRGQKERFYWDPDLWLEDWTRRQRR